MVERGTGKLLVGIAAPSEKNLIPWLKEHPSYQVYLHAKGGKSESVVCLCQCTASGHSHLAMAVKWEWLEDGGGGS